MASILFYFPKSPKDNPTMDFTTAPAVIGTASTAIHSQDYDVKTRAGFFRFPMEIREEIYYLALVMQCGDHFVSWPSNDIRLDPSYSGPHPDERIRIATIYWGLHVSSNLYPISQQWYAEIQHVLVSRFIFTVCGDILPFRPGDMSCCLGLIPGFQSIRCLRLPLGIPWNSVKPDEVRMAEHEWQRLAANLPALIAVTFELGQSLGNNEEHYHRKLVRLHLKPRVLSMTMDLIRHFKHVPEINFSLQYPVSTYFEEPMDPQGVEYEILLMEAAKLLREEIRSEHGGDEQKVPRMNIGPEWQSATIWKKRCYTRSWGRKKDLITEK